MQRIDFSLPKTAFHSNNSNALKIPRPVIRRTKTEKVKSRSHRSAARESKAKGRKIPTGLAAAKGSIGLKEGEKEARHLDSSPRKSGPDERGSQNGKSNNRQWKWLASELSGDSEGPVLEGVEATSKQRALPSENEDDSMLTCYDTKSKQRSLLSDDEDDAAVFVGG